MADLRWTEAADRKALDVAVFIESYKGKHGGSMPTSALIGKEFDRGPKWGSDYRNRARALGLV